MLTWFDHRWMELFVFSEQLDRWSSHDDLMRYPSDENVHIVNERLTGSRSD